MREVTTKKMRKRKGKPVWPRTMTDMWKWPMAVEEAELIITDTDTSFLKLWRTLNCPQGCKEPETYFWFISTQNMPETCQNKLHLLITLKTRLFSPHGFTGGEALCVLAALNLFSPLSTKNFFIVAQDHLGNYERTLHKEKETPRKI